MSEDASGELISFLVGDQEFCVDIMLVREIRGWTPSTPLPHAPAHVLGVINLRGAVLPVIDLRARLDLGRSIPSSSHVVMVASVGGVLSGLLVDAVCDILTVTDDMLQKPPALAGSQTSGMVTGIMTIEGRMITLLDLNGVVPRGAEQDQAA